MLIGINGKTGSGRNTIARIIQYLQVNKIMESNGNYTGKYNNIHGVDHFINDVNGCTALSNVEIKKYSDKIKQIGCIILGCEMSDWDDDEFLDKELGEEWWVIYLFSIYYPYSRRNEFSKNIVEKHLIKPTPRTFLNITNVKNLIDSKIKVNSLFNDYEEESNCCGDGRFCDYGDGEMDGNCAKPLEDSKWIITDVGTKAEAGAIKDRGGILIRVNRNCDTCKTIDSNICSNSYHISETELDYFNDFKYVIDNNGTIEELVEKVKVILEQENLL